jgi:C_GCAxxG_C_C family probable redox protein
MASAPRRYADEAAAQFRRGYNCAQATAVVFAEDFGLAPALVLQLTAGLGGGMGGLRETCGAVSAMAVLAGLALGPYEPDDLAAKTARYDLVKRWHAQFVARHGSACCRELLERAGIVPDAQPAERDAEYYAKRPCPQLVASAAEIVASALNESRAPRPRRRSARARAKSGRP